MNSDQNYNSRQQQGQYSRNPRNQGYSNNNNDQGVGNQRYNSPNKQNQQQYRNQRQNYQPNSNFGDNNQGGGVAQQNRNFQQRNPRQFQGGQKNQGQLQNQGYGNQQNNRSRSSNSRNQRDGANGDWQQQKVQQQQSNYYQNGSNIQRRQNKPNQIAGQNRISNAVNQRPNGNQPRQQGFGLNKQIQSTNQQFNAIRGYTPPPKPIRNNQQGTDQASAYGKPKKAPYVNKEMKNFINDKEGSQESNSQEYDEDEEIDNIEEQDNSDELDQEDQSGEYDDEDQEKDSNSQYDDDDEDQDDEQKGDYSDEDQEENSMAEEDQSYSNNNESNSGYNEIKHAQKKEPTRELTIRRVPNNEKIVGVDSDNIAVSSNNEETGFKINNYDGDQRALNEQANNLSQMCHETIDDTSWEWHIRNRPELFAFFERNKKGEPQKQIAMKYYYRSAAAKELNMSDILSPFAIKKSTDRMIDELLDYFLSPNVNVKNLVNNFTNRLRTLTAELEPLSQHLSLYNSSKMMIDIKERLLAIHLGGMNYFRKQSCLKDSEQENGYNEKKLNEQLQTLSDTIFTVYEQNVEKIKNIIEKNRKVDMEVLKKQILENENAYISPLIPKIVAWRLLIRLEEPQNLHKMDNLLNLTYDSLVHDQSFCAVFELITCITKKNYYKYFEMLNNDPRIDYLTSNACLIHLANIRLHYILQERYFNPAFKNLPIDASKAANVAKNLQFDLSKAYDRESFDYFLQKLGSSLQEFEDNPKPQIDPNRADSISLRQLYWPNFYEKIEWRKPKSFKETIRKIFKECEENNFPEILIENMIRKDRKMPIISYRGEKPAIAVQIPQVEKTKIPATVQTEIAKKIKPIMNFNLSMKKAKENSDLMSQEQQLKQNDLTQKMNAENDYKLKEEQKRNEIIYKWGLLIDSAFTNQKSQLINELYDTIDQVKGEEFQESYLSLKYFLRWKTIFKQIKYQRETANYINRYRNQQKVCYGINNEKISLQSNYVFRKPSPMEIESESSNKEKVSGKDQNAFYQDFLKVFNEREKLLSPEIYNFLDMISINFLKEKNKMFTHFYYKITIVSDEQNPLIVKMVNSFSNYLSQGKISQDQNIFNITIAIEDITIEYTLQLQMAKYLRKIHTKELSGTDLFIYIFNEQDDAKNKEYYTNFKNHLNLLIDNKISMGFNLLFLSVNELIKGKDLENLNLFNKKNGKNLQESSQKNSMHNLQMNKSISSHTAYQMMLEMSYTDPDVQDSEGYVRRAIKYLNQRFDLKRDVEENSIYQYYNVISYTYETINGKCINEDPFSERIFKASIDSAIEKSIRVKSPFGKITLTSFSQELKKIKQILAFGKGLTYAIPSKTSGIPPLPANSSGRTLYKQLRDFLQKEQVLDANKYNDMKNYFYFKYLFNNTLFQLIENFIGIMEQSHLIPFDQLNEFEQNQLLLLEETLEIVKEQLDRVFMRNSNKYLRSYIRKNYFTSFSYQNVVNIIDQYYKLLLEISSSNDLENENETTFDSTDLNNEAYQNLKREMVDTVRNNFTFDQKHEQGIIGNWQAIFIKLLDQLISIFEDNDIPMFLSQNFQFKFECKTIKKNVQIEYIQMNEWLRDLKATNDDYLNRQTEVDRFLDDHSDSTNKKIKQEGLENQQYVHHKDPQAIIDLYSNLLDYNKDVLLNREKFNDQHINGIHNNGDKKQKQQQNGDQLKLKEKYSSLNYSKSDNSSAVDEDDEISSISSESQDERKKNQKENSESSSDYDEQQQVPIQNKNFNKRRTACLVPNKKDDGETGLQYSEKIRKLMRGEIVGSPTHLDDSFV